VLRALRDGASPELPVIVVTSRDGEADVAGTLRQGADDYVVKPYRMRELTARIRAALRRTLPADSGSITSDSAVVVGDVSIDPERHVVVIRGDQTKLPLKEFELLYVLMANAGRVMTREQLIDRVWGSDYYGDTKTLDVHIKRLRSKVEPDPAAPRSIVTIRGLGYKFERA